MKRTINTIIAAGIWCIIITFFAGCAKEKTNSEKEYEQVKAHYADRDLDVEIDKLNKEISAFNNEFQTLLIEKESMDKEIQRLKQLHDSSTDVEIQKLQEQIKQESSCYQIKNISEESKEEKPIENIQSPNTSIDKEKEGWFKRTVNWIYGLRK